MKVWKAMALGLTATAAFLIALTLTGLAHGLALLIYVLFLVAMLLVTIVGRLRDVLPPTVEFRRMLAAPSRGEIEVEQFEKMKLSLAISRHSRTDLYVQLRPPVRDIVAARLFRDYGIDLDHEPDRAEAILGGGRAWELVRRDYRSPDDRSAPGWSEHELEQLVEELERL